MFFEKFSGVLFHIHDGFKYQPSYHADNRHPNKVKHAARKVFEQVCQDASVKPRMRYYRLSKMVRHKIAIPSCPEYYRRLAKDHVTGWKRLIDISAF